MGFGTLLFVLFVAAWVAAGLLVIGSFALAIWAMPKTVQLSKTMIRLYQQRRRDTA